MLLLRRISKGRWLSDGLSWLAADDVPGLALKDLMPQDNALSTWVVDAEKKNLDRVIAAVAASAEQLDKFDYVILDDDELGRRGIRVQETLGVSPDDDLNSTHHRDLIEMSARKICVLAADVLRTIEKARVNERQVENLVKAGIQLGHIAPSKLSEHIRRHLAII